MNIKQLNKKLILIGLVGATLLAAGFYFFVYTHRTVEISAQVGIEEGIKYETHPLTGIACANHNKRPYAVMLASDHVVRPLSSIAQADFVVEIPVVQNNITRIMALYVCSEPDDIGSIRSARHDFIPLASALDTIYAHWGGSNFALERLNVGALDNIDALINPASAFFRKAGIVAPHNGFTSYERLSNSANYLGYRAENNFEGYLRIPGDPTLAEGPTTLRIEYRAPYNVMYIYNDQTNSYMRWRGGTPEIDKNTNEQVEAKVIIILKTTSRQLNADYNDVDVTGEGEAFVFQNGAMQKAKWQKAESPLNAKLKFLNEHGEEISLVAGKTWLQYVDVRTEVMWGESRL